MQKAPGGVELKPPDKGEQPMDLAPRTAHQHVAASAAKPTQLQVTTIGPALRPHLDTAKSAFTVRTTSQIPERRLCPLLTEAICFPVDVPDFLTIVFTTRLDESVR